MILILSNPADVHARHVASLLHRRGHDNVTISKADFGNGASVTFRPEARSGVIALGDGTHLMPQDVSTVWHRRPGRIQIDPGTGDERDRAFMESEWTTALDAFLSAPFRRHVSPPANQRAATKPVQLACAAQAGLRVPRTLITSDPARAAGFVAEHRGAIVHKAMTAPSHRFLETRGWDSLADSRLADLSYCPTIVQERIVGPGDIRATVVGRAIFAARIETSLGRAGVDSRLDQDAPCAAYELPPDILTASLRLMESLGLVFATIDFKLADNGEHVFLELNPQGQFLYIEIQTGLPISEALAEFLADG